MKTKLIKDHQEYMLINDERFVIATTDASMLEVTDKMKLSKQNCDDIFGTIDVEKLAEESWGDKISSPYHAYIEGFKKAMELNKDTLFTVEDMHEALHLMNNTPRVPIVGEALEIVRKETEIRESIVDAILISKQPTEIEVEIVMKPYTEVSEGWILDKKEEPKLDENGCLILTKKI